MLMVISPAKTLDYQTPPATARFTLPEHLEHSNVLIEQLRNRATQEQLQPEQRAEKTRIMQRILQNDAQIRYLAEPWLAHCDQQLGGPPEFLH